MICLGLDIGGANLKAADGEGWARSVPFALWRYPERLAEELEELLADCAAADRLAVTMTGELCDCFSSQAEGVRHILAAVARAAGQRDVSVYLVDGRLASVDEACELPHLAAASNWHALARFACRYADGCPGLLIDVGSTTTDVIPLVDGKPAAQGRCDTERLAAGELVYSGVARTPVCAVVGELPWRDSTCPIAAELFATTADVYLILGQLAEEPAATWTADGRPLSVECARARLARMICADGATLDMAAARRAAEAVRNAQFARLCRAAEMVIARMPCEPQVMIPSGQGEFLACKVVERLVMGRAVVSLRAELGEDVSRCAPAHALAVLARENWR